MRSLKIKNLFYRNKYLKLENKLNLYTFISRALLSSSLIQKNRFFSINYKLNLLKLKKLCIKTKLIKRCLFTNCSQGA